MAKNTWRTRQTVTVSRSALDELRGHLEGATGWHWSNAMVLNWCLFQTEQALTTSAFKRPQSQTSNVTDVEDDAIRVTVVLDAQVLGRLQSRLRAQFTGVNMPHTYIIQYAMRQALLAWRSGDVTRFGMLKPQRPPDIIINDPSIVQKTDDDEPTLMSVHTHKRKPIKNGAL